jgi:D-alanyl-D-alanine dipeptidase
LLGGRGKRDAIVRARSCVDSHTCHSASIEEFRMQRLLVLSLSLALAACATATQPRKPAPESSPTFFHIEPVTPVAELLPLALAASPPQEKGEFRGSDLLELSKLDSGIKLDIRYATSHNFLGTPLYSQARAFLQRPAAEALVRVQRSLAADGYGLLVHDAYRPWYVTKLFWDATPADKHNFVADPAKGSRHNRGCAVDLTLYDLGTGRAVEMPSLYDEMSERAYPTYAGGGDAQRALRDLLRQRMEAEGFAVYEFEWWHFDYRDWQAYAIQNLRFEAIGSP